MSQKDLHEPDDKAVEGANKAANGCGMIMVGGFICVIIYSVGVIFSWW